MERRDFRLRYDMTLYTILIIIYWNEIKSDLHLIREVSIMNPRLVGLLNFLMMVASQSSEVNLWTWTNTFSVHNNSLASKKSEDILNVSWSLIFPSFFSALFSFEYLYLQGRDLKWGASWPQSSMTGQKCRPLVKRNTRAMKVHCLTHDERAH